MAAGLGIAIVLSLLAFKVTVFLVRLVWSLLLWMLGNVFQAALIAAVLGWLFWAYEHRANKPTPERAPPALDTGSSIVVKV